MQQPNAADIQAAVDYETALNLLCAAVEIASVTGQEQRFAEFLAARQEFAADQVELIDVAPGRPLVWTRTRGRGEAPTVLLVAHLDTVAPSGPPPIPGREDAAPFAATVHDDKVYGLGVADAKGGIVTSLSALATLQGHGIRPAGDVITLWIPDEESGIPGHGRSLGIAKAVELIEQGTVKRPDFAIYHEPTGLSVYNSQPGFVVARIQIHGKGAYWATPDDGIDALDIGLDVGLSLRQLRSTLRERVQRKFAPNSGLHVNEFHAGRTISVADSCVIALIRHFAEDESIETVANEIRQTVDAALPTGVRASVTFADGRDHVLGGLPAATDPRTPPLAALRRCIDQFAPGRSELAPANYWSEMGYLTKLGIPTVYWSPGDIRNCHTRNEVLDLVEFRAAIPSLALFLAAPPSGS